MNRAGAAFEMSALVMAGRWLIARAWLAAVALAAALCVLLLPLFALWLLAHRAPARRRVA